MAMRHAVKERSVELGPPAPELTPAQRLGDHLRALKRRWFIVLFAVAFASGSAYYLTDRATDKYDAAARVLLERSGPINTLVDPGAAPFSSDPERDVNTGVALITLDSVARRVAVAVPFAADTATLLAQVRTDVEGNSDIVRVVVRDVSPARAAIIANEFARQYVAFRRRSAKARFQQAARLARTQLRSLTPQERASAQGRALRENLRELEIASVLQTGGARVVDQAEPPTVAATPRPFLAAAIAGVLGLVLGILFALWREFADRRLRTMEDVEAVLDVPVLGTIPKGSRAVIGRATDRRTRLEQESYSTLAVNLRFLTLVNDSPMVLVTSPAAQDGKTVVTLRLAGALAAVGHRVLAVEADLRHPSFAKYLDLPRGPGLAMVLAGISELPDELVSIDAGTLERNTSASPAENSSFLVLPAGRAVPNPHGVLTSERMRRLLAEAYSHADIILIDTPPVGVVSDAAGLADIATSCLVVLRLNRTTRDEARGAVRALQTVETNVSGLVLTGTRPDFHHYHYYSD
jgi:polysaccharide biosynthesis transport protein